MVDSYDNLILLCRNDHKKVDDQAQRFTTPRLLQLKAEHEEKVEHTLGGIGSARHGSRIGGLPLVRDFVDWDVLGVHRPFTVFADGTDRSAEADAGVLPSYVPRDKDEAELRPHLRTMAGSRPPVNVRLIVVAGESGAGKTRMAVEAMRAELGEWRLLVPTGVHSIPQLQTGHLYLWRTVVWLDEVQEFLAQPNGTALLWQLLAAPSGPIVLLGTIRTDVDESLRGTSGWRLLDRRAVRIHLPRRFNDAELTAAHGLNVDPWIREALAGTGDRYGLAEVLAAGPQLIREWDRLRDRDPLAAMIVDAAVDCHRAGYTDPLPARVLHEACQYYVDARTTLAADTFAAALDRVRTPICGASGLLVHSRLGDRAFDYLLTHASGSHYRPVPAAVWTLLPRHATPGMLRPLAHAARRKGHHHLASEYLRRAASPAVSDLALLAEWPDTAALQARLNDGDPGAAEYLERNQYQHDHEDEQCSDAESAETDGADSANLDLQVARELSGRGDLRGLCNEAKKGNRLAESIAAVWFFLREDEPRLRTLTDDQPAAEREDGWAATFLNELYVQRGDERALLRRADAGDEDAADRLAQVYAERGDVHLLRERAVNGDRRALRVLVNLLADGGNEDEVREWAVLDPDHAGLRLANLLAERGDEEGLRERMVNGCRHAPARLASLRTARGADCADLPTHADAGSSSGWLPSPELPSVPSDWRTDDGDRVRRAEEDLRFRLVRTPLGVHGAVVGQKRAGRLWVVADTDASAESIDEAVEALLFSEWYYSGLGWNAG